MRARKLLGLLALAPWAVPASAAITIDEAQVSDGGGLVIAGQVTPAVRSVILTIGPLTSIVLTPDASGRFVWIDPQVPPECAVSLTAGGERVVTGIAGCGSNASFTVEAARTPTTSSYSYGSSDYRTDQPAAGGGASGTTTYWSNRHDERVETRTVRHVFRPTFISPNDPRYADAEPPHGGEPVVQGTHSVETLPPPRGFYAGIRSKEGGGN